MPLQMTSSLAVGVRKPKPTHCNGWVYWEPGAYWEPGGQITTVRVEFDPTHHHTFVTGTRPPGPGPGPLSKGPRSQKTAG